MAEKEDNNTEQRILDAAEQVFLRDGLAGARMQDIANVANINKALLHYYFRTKDKLFEMIFRAKMNELMPKLSSYAAQDATLLEVFDHFIDTYIAILQRNPYMPMFVLSTISRNPDFVKNVSTDLGQVLVARFEKEIAAGQIRPVHPHQFMMSLMGMCLFPYVGKPMFKQVFNIEEATYKELLADRQRHIKTYIHAILGTEL